jgi:hypothetical protein
MAINIDHSRKSDLQQQVLNYLKAHSSHAKISVLSESISFNLTSVSEDVLKTNYIKGFSFNKDSLAKNAQAVIEKVNDSLKDLSTSLNNQCPKQDIGSLPKLQRREGYVAFLSPICRNVIYAELVHSSGIISNGNRYEISGRADTFVFLIENDKIKRVYSGHINYE